MRETPQSFKFGDGNTTPIEDQLIEKFSVEESVNEDVATLQNLDARNQISNYSESRSTARQPKMNQLLNQDIVVEHTHIHAPT